MSRRLSPNPFCQDGFAKDALAPPPVAHRPALRPHCAGVQLSFHTFSGMYESAVTRTFVLELQYLLVLLPSLNSVPPTATVNGVDAGMLTDNPNRSAVEP